MSNDVVRPDAPELGASTTIPDPVSNIPAAPIAPQTATCSYRFNDAFAQSKGIQHLCGMIPRMKYFSSNTGDFEEIGDLHPNSIIEQLLVRMLRLEAFPSNDENYKKYRIALSSTLPPPVIIDVIENGLGYGAGGASLVFNHSLKEIGLGTLGQKSHFFPEFNLFNAMLGTKVPYANNPWQKIFALPQQTRPFFADLALKLHPQARLNDFQGVKWTQEDFTYRDVLEHARQNNVMDQAKDLFETYYTEVSR